MGKLLFASVVAAAVGSAVPAFADVQLSMQNGRVTILAKDATVRQILAEWARVGQTKIVNVERIPGGPITLELRDVPEQEALKVLLRSISGYMAAPRAASASPTSSVFDRIIVMPTLAAASAPLSAGPPSVSAPTFVQPQVPFTDENADDQRPNVPAGIPQPAANRGPVFVFPQPQVAQPPQPANQQQPTPPQFFLDQQPTAAPATPPAVSYPGAPTITTTPAGVAVPGMVVPAPASQQPGQPVQVQPRP